MITQIFFSSPQGDIPVQDRDLNQPFILAESEVHPTLTLSDYFAAITNLILREKDFLRQLIDLNHEPGTKDSENTIEKLVIRSEKHGLLYHIASAELFFNDLWHGKFALSTALSEKGRKCLQQDYCFTKKLSTLPGCSSYLPALYLLDENPFHTSGKNVSGMMVVGEWLEDFHEWHQSFDRETREYQLVLWDYIRGNRILPPACGAKIFHQIAKILTSLYDPDTQEQIYPWHHAAGDFIVKWDNDTLEVRLITVRGYHPLISIPTEEPASQLTAIILFFLHVTIRMRLDKLDGVGDITWLDDYVVSAAAHGFFSALAEKNGLAEMPFSPGQLLKIMRSFAPEDFLTMCQPLLELYRADSEADYQVILQNIEKHLELICGVLQAIRAEKSDS
jgi:hypothetical protein